MLEVAEKQEPTESESPTNIKKDSYKFLGSRSERVIFIFFLTLLSCAPIIFGKEFQVMLTGIFTWNMLTALKKPFGKDNFYLAGMILQ